MGSVHMHNGIGISYRTGNRFIDVDAMLARTASPSMQPTITQPGKSTIGYDSSLWAAWGPSNTLPDQMIIDIETCGILNSIIDHQSRLALGEGVLWAWCAREKTGKLTVEEIADIPEINDFMDFNNHYYHELGWMKDQIGFANAVARIILNVDKNKIARLQRDDVTEMRYQKMNSTTGNIEKLYLSAQWATILSSATIDPAIIKTFPLLPTTGALQVLEEKKQGAHEFAYTFKYPGWGKKYYSLALWFANLNWVRIAQSVPSMKAALYNNSMRPKYLITVYKEHWENMFIGEGDGRKKSFDDYTEMEIQDKKNEFYDQVDAFLVGAENAGKAIFVDGWTDPHSGKSFKYVDIESIDDTTKDGGYLPDSAAANSEIAFSMRYNPSILGATMPSGPYTNSQGGSSVREAVTVQIITHEPERQNILSIYKLVRNFNKWQDDYKKGNLKLEPIIPATILTTLDTGAGTKGVLMGGAEPGKENESNNKPIKNHFNGHHQNS